MCHDLSNFRLRHFNSTLQIYSNGIGVDNCEHCFLPKGHEFLKPQPKDQRAVANSAATWWAGIRVVHRYEVDPVDIECRLVTTESTITSTIDVDNI